MPNGRQNLTRFLIGTVATVAFLWLFLRAAHLGDAWQEISRLPMWAFAAALVCVLLNIGFVTLRWRYLLQASGVRLSMARLFPTLAVATAANNVVPARGGDLIRIESLRRGEHVPGFVVAGTIFAERLLDGIVLSGFILAGALLIGHSGAMLLAGIALSAGASLGIALAILAAARPETVEKAAWRITNRLSGRWQRRIGRATANFVAGLAAFRAPHALWRIAWTSVAIWTCNLGMYIAIGYGFHLDLALGGFLLLEGMGNLALGVPATAAGLGTFDYLTFLSAREIGVAPAAGGAFVLVVHAFTVIPVTLLGAVLVKQAFPQLFRSGRESPDPLHEPG
jgi:uncharacterized protein (TIRG00374 family)